MSPRILHPMSAVQCNFRTRWVPFNGTFASVVGAVNAITFVSETLDPSTLDCHNWTLNPSTLDCFMALLFACMNSGSHTWEWCTCRLWTTAIPMHVFFISNFCGDWFSILFIAIWITLFLCSKLSVWMFASAHDYWPTMHQCICGSSFYVCDSE